MNSTFQHNLNLALVISVLLHILLGLNLTFYRSVPQESAAIEVEFSPDKQIVTPSNSVETPPLAPPETNRLSDLDSAVEKESIKRGEAGAPIRSMNDSGAVTPPQAEAKKLPMQTPNKPAPKEVSKTPPNLKLDQSTLLDQFGRTPKPARVDPLNELNSEAANYQAFSRPPGSGARFMGNGGSSDYLPSLPDGDLTLLNAKANQYAVFVRRVAVQVFAELRQVGWESLRAADIRGISSDSIFEAVMGPNGELVSVTPVEASGSRNFDEVLRIAVTKGARDRNPPAGAKADDGQIHFIFKARSWVGISNGARNQAPIERRWLLLATGLL